MKIAIILPDGVGIRNYLYSSIPKLIKTTNNLVIISPLGDRATQQELSVEAGVDLEFVGLPNYSENLLTKICRESATYARLISTTVESKNPTLMSNWKPKRNSGMNKAFYKFVEVLGWFASQSQRFVIGLDRMQDAILRRGACYRDSKVLLAATDIEALFCTHQRAINAVPLILAAQDLGVRTVSAIYSWDNLPKGRLLVKADEYVVWSEYMKDELVAYYPEEKSKSIHVTGTPQFEFYFDEKNYGSREDFCKEFDLDTKRKIICYSGGDTRTSPFDQEFLRDLARSIQDIPMATRPQIILRRCPVDFSDRYDDVLAEFCNDIRVSHPKWKQGTNRHWTHTYPLYEDIKLLVNTVRHCDAVYNVGSTMAHDFFTHGKPAIYANYDPPAASGSGWSTETIYQFQHFRSMPSKSCVEWVNSNNEILPTLEQVLSESYQPSPESRLWFDKIAGPKPENASQRILKVLTQ